MSSGESFSKGFIANRKIQRNQIRKSNVFYNIFNIHLSNVIHWSNFYFNWESLESSSECYIRLITISEERCRQEFGCYLRPIFLVVAWCLNLFYGIRRIIYVISIPSCIFSILLHSTEWRETPRLK